jgi:hypothetical protein
VKKILILCFSNLERDPRVYRQIIALKDDFKVVAAGCAHPKVDGVDFVALKSGSPSFFQKIYGALLRACHLDKKYYWSHFFIQDAYTQLSCLECDLILANDLDTLPLAVRLAQEKKVKLIYDAHEYAPREFESSFKWRILWQQYKTRLCRDYLPKVDAMITVCQGIADEYKRQFRVKSVLVFNAPAYENLEPLEVKSKIRLIHHGAAIRERNIESMIDLMKELDDRFELNLMLVPSDKCYFSELQKKCFQNPKIKWLEPVKMPDISKKINQFDIGLYLLNDVGFNARFSLPNKFFEFIQARLMLAIGPSIEMARLVRENDLGIVSKNFSFTEMAKMLNTLSLEEILRYKKNSHIAAKKLSFEASQALLFQLVSHVLESK